MFKKENKEIKITREEFVGKFMEVICDPFKDYNEIAPEDKAQMQISVMLTGMLLLKQMDKKLFGEE